MEKMKTGAGDNGDKNNYKIEILVAMKSNDDIDQYIKKICLLTFKLLFL